MPAVEEAGRLRQEDADRAAKKERLRKGAPDSLVLTEDERLSLDEAIAALNDREEKARAEADERKRQREE